MSISGKKILILGDSLSTGNASPGGVLGAQLRAAGATVRVNGKVSRSAVNLWSGANGENGAAVIAAEVAWQPDIVIVMLGTNDLGMGAAADQAAFARIAAAFHTSELWAIGPPSFARADLQGKTAQVYLTMQRVFGGARVIDWRMFTGDILTSAQGRAGDGVHFAAAGAAVAGKRLANAFLKARERYGLTTSADGSAMPAIAVMSWWPVPMVAAVAAAVMVGVAWVVRRRNRVRNV